MLSLLSNLISPKPTGWTAAVQNPLKEIEQFYVTSTEIPLRERRIMAKERLCRVNGFTPQLAQIIVKQWDDANPKILMTQKRSPKSQPGNTVRPSQKASFSNTRPTRKDKYTPLVPPPIRHLKLGHALLKAGLIGPYQIEVALMDAQYRTDLRIGEILALRGWIQQETADFFADKLIYIPTVSQKQPIGQYLKAAKLLTQQQIDSILEHQSHNSFSKFGEAAVYKNYLKQQTLDFILSYIT